MTQKKKKPIRVFVDAEVLVLPHFSGIGHYTASLLKAVDDALGLEAYSHIQVTLGAPRGSMHKLARFGFDNFAFKSLPFTHHEANGLKKRHWIPPIDLFFGKQVFVFPNYSSWPTLFSPSVPIIYDLSFVKYPQFGDSNNMRFLSDQVLLSTKRATKAITISKNSQTEICKEYHRLPADVPIVYPVIEMRNFYRRSDLEIRQVKAKYGIFDNYILFVGNLEPRKNLISLLRAYSDLPRDIQKKYALLLIGAKGWKDGEIHKMIQSMRMQGLHVIQPVDYVLDEDLPALISGARSFAYVSIYEGFGIPPVEALACGVPVVVSNNSSLPEATGEAAYYVNATNNTQIKDALLASLKDDGHNRDKGYEQAKKFSADYAAKTFLSIVEGASRK